MDPAGLEARVADFYAALRRPRPAVLLARDPADHARLTLAAAQRPFSGYELLTLVMGAALSATYWAVAFPSLTGLEGHPAPVKAGLLLAATLAWLSFFPLGRAASPWLRLAPLAAPLLAGALAGLALGGPSGLGLGLLVAGQLWLWAALVRFAVGPVWTRRWLRRRRGVGPPLLGGVPLQELVEERLRHAVEGLRAPAGVPSAPLEPTPAEREAGRRVRLLLERGSETLLPFHRLLPSLGRGADALGLGALRRGAAPGLPVLAERALEVDRATVAVTLLDGCAVVLPATPPDPPMGVDSAAALEGLLAPAWLVWLARRLPAGPGLRLAAAALDREPDPALRQETVERLGPGRVLAALRRKPVAEDERGALFGLGPEPRPTLFVRVQDPVRGPDGEPKEHWLPVPPHVASAREAVAWTFGRPAAAYAPELET